MEAFNTLTRTRITTRIARIAVFSSLLLLATSCVPGGGPTGSSSDTSDCNQGSPNHVRHHHPEWGDDKGHHNQDWDDDKGFHHHEWDDDQGHHHHEWCDDNGNHYHDYDDKDGHHHHEWCDDHGHKSHDYDDDHGHHHDGDDDDHTATATSTAVAKPCTVNTSTVTNTSTSTSTATYAFPVLPGRTCTIDTFQQSTQSQAVKKVDILFVMDHSGSMQRHWDEIAQNIESMVKQLPSTTDIRYGVMLADVGAWSGRLYSPFGAAYLDNQQMSTAQIATALQKTFAAAMSVSDAGSGEASLYSLTQAVTKNAAMNQKAGFFRPDAGLSVLFMSDENDIGVSVPKVAGVPVKCDASTEATIKKTYYDKNGITVASTVAALQALKGSLPVKASAFVNITTKDLFTDNSPNARCIYDNIGYGYIDIANAMKGTLFSIQQDKATGLTQCGQMINQSLALQHDFPLSQPAAAVDPATILNAVDAALVDGTYTSSNDSEHLDNAGAAGSTIQIRYCAPTAVIAWTLTNFAGTPSQTSVGLSWLTSQHATNGKVMWGPSANALNNEVDEASAVTNHAVTVSGLTPNTLYYFQATSTDENGQSQSSPVLSFTTNPDWSITNVVAQAARTTASIQWTTAEYATSGHVNWGLSANALTNQTADVATANTHQIALSGLTAATTYYYQVVASDLFGLTKQSAVMSFTTEADWGIFGFAGAATRTTVTLQWTTPDQVTTGTILWGSSAALGNTANEGAAAANNHELTVSGLNPDTDYYFQAVNTDATGVVKSSNVILVHTAVDWLFTGFAGVSTQTSVTLTWTTPGYNTSGSVAYGLSSSALSSSAADTVNGTSHSVTVSGLTAGTVYYFQGSSTDSDGITKQSAVLAISTQAVPLPTWTISGLAGTSTTTTVTINWQTTQYATSGSVLWGDSLTTMSNSVADSVTGTSHSVTISGLTAGTTYFFQAIASDDRGQTQNSDVIQVVTMSGTVTPPSNWTISGFDGTTTGTQANLIWTTPGAQTTAVVNVGLSATDLSLMSIPVTTASDTQQLAVPGLNTSTQYFFQVVATDTAGRTVESVIISKTTKAQ
ncbi:MAG: fibronectin type III domain-containing protein [Bdellovibrionota bacterium]